MSNDVHRDEDWNAQSSGNNLITIDPHVIHQQ